MYVAMYVPVCKQLAGSIKVSIYHACMCVITFIAQNISCDGCVRVTICRPTTGGYLMQFSMLFNQSNSPCELYYLNGSTVSNVTLIEGKCTDLPPNSNYSMLCPICPNGHLDIYYEILTSNIEDCSNGKY